MEENTWKLITDIILYASFALVGVFAILGVAQLISRKSIKKVDKQLLWFPLPMILMAATYLICDKVLPQFIDMPTRPNGSGEPSFPSTHVMVVTTIFFCISAAMSKYVKSRSMLIFLDVIMFILASIVATGRLMSHMHSYVDVIGAVVFAFIFYEIYYQCIRKKKSKKEKEDA